MIRHIFEHLGYNRKSPWHILFVNTMFCFIHLCVTVCVCYLHSFYTFLNHYQDVDQETGEDINPSQTRSLTGGEVRDETEARNPDRPTVQALLDMPDLDEVKDVKKGRRMTSPERWEINRMIAANVIDKSEYPDFDEETGLLPKEDDSGLCIYHMKLVQMYTEVG